MYMRKLLLPIFIFLFFIGCGKKDTVCNFNDSTVVAPSSEVASVQAYLSSNNITATAHPSGLYYQIIAQGGGTSVVNLCSNVSVTYVGKLSNGTIFDQTSPNSPVTFQLGQVIVGWQKGVPLINSGGTIRLFIPPSLGYGNRVQGPIPANSILIFDITIVGIS